MQRCVLHLALRCWGSASQSWISASTVPLQAMLGSAPAWAGSWAVRTQWKELAEPPVAGRAVLVLPASPPAQARVRPSEPGKAPSRTPLAVRQSSASGERARLSAAALRCRQLSLGAEGPDADNDTRSRGTVRAVLPVPAPTVPFSPKQAHAASKPRPASYPATKRRPPVRSFRLRSRAHRRHWACPSRPSPRLLHRDRRSRLLVDH